MSMVIVVILSLILSAILNKLAVSKGWKKKVEKYGNDRAYIRLLPILLIVIYLATVLVLPRVGIILPLPLLLIIQVVCITLAVFLFELFR